MIKVITRCDDAGSSHAANRAIVKVLKRGLIKNVSIMAPTAFVEEFRRLSQDLRGVTFGLHFTLNAEWDRVKWKPLSEVPDSLVDESGYFLTHPSLFLKTKPDLEPIRIELEAQYQKLIRLGFDISYVDSHMLPELFIPGLFEEIDRFCQKNGLINHSYYYDLFSKNVFQNKDEYEGRQLFLVIHPSKNTKEMRMTGNQEYSGKEVAASRAKETKLFSSFFTKMQFRIRGIVPISYVEATPKAENTLIQFEKELNQNE